MLRCSGGVCFNSMGSALRRQCVEGVVVFIACVPLSVHHTVASLWTYPGRLRFACAPSAAIKSTQTSRPASSEVRFHCGVMG
mgnify:CR=1 FL=1